MLFALLPTVLVTGVIASAIPQDDPTTLPCGAVSSVNHIIVAGDTLSAVARQYKSGVCDIAKLNGLSNANVVVPGQLLRIPVSCTSPDNSSCLGPATSPATASCAIAVSSAYRVKSGDTLSTIAGGYNITLDGLVAANKQITNIDVIFPGDIVDVPICPGTQCLVKTYTIKSGDIFFDLAARIGTTVGNVEGLNLNVNPTGLAIGHTILLPAHCNTRARVFL